MDTILVGYDESEAAERALARAAELARALGARLVVASVSDEPRVPPEPVLEPGPAGLIPPGGTGPAPTAGSIPFPAEAPPARPDPEQLAERRLERARLALAGQGLDADYVAETGDAPERLLELAERCNAELIVVGSREHGFLDRLLGRGVDEAVAVRSTRDVLLVR